MDEVDLQLMRRIGLAPFLVWPHPPSALRPAALARAVGTSVDTVKRRLAALREAGVFHGTMVFPNPRLLGLRLASFHFRPDAAQPRVAAQTIADVPGVLGVFDMVGGDRCIDAAFADDGDRSRLLEGLGETLRASSGHFVDYATPVPGGTMASLDWRLLLELRRRPDVTLDEAAEAVGVTVRTAKRRFDRMVRDGCLDVVGLFNPGAVPGHFVVDLVFRLREGSGQADVAAVLNAFRSRWLAQWSPPDRRLGHVALVLVASSARELEDLRREAESLACVERCEALIVEGALENWSWLDARIAERAGAVPGERSAAAPPLATPRKAVVVQNPARRAR